MSDVINAHDIETAARRVCQMIDEQAGAFNQLDAATGDGDMGSTLQIVARAVLEDTSGFPPDLSGSFGRLAMTLARTSGSSLCAVLMTGLISLSKASGAETECTVKAFIPWLDAALKAMQTRSRANFGDKTILDGFKAIVDASTGATTLDSLGERANDAATTSLTDFHDLPTQIGRGRLAERKGAGLDDPGMVFLSYAIRALIGRVD